MAANLDRTESGDARMFYVRSEGTPWHEEGTEVSEAKVAAEAIKLAGMDWNVIPEPVCDSRGVVIPEYQAMVRDTDRKVVGVVGSRYIPIQNSQCFDFLDSLYADGVLTYNTAGVLDGGSVVWVQTALAKGMRILDDEYNRFLHAASSHNASLGLSVHAGNVRIVCENTFVEANRGSMLARITHTGDITAKMEAARKLIKIVDDRNARMEKWLTGLTKVEVSADAVTGFRDEMFGPLDDATPAQRRTAIESFVKIYDAEKERNGATAYSLFNAVTGYADHAVRVKSGSSRLKSLLVGRSQQVKAEGIKLVGELAGSVI